MNERMGQTPATRTARRERSSAGATRHEVGGKGPSREVHGKALALALAWLVAGCSGTKTVGGEEPEAGLGAAAPDDPEGGKERLPTEEELGPITKNSFREHSAGSAWVFDSAPNKDGTKDGTKDGKPRQMPIGAAEALGYSIIDLSNDWTPYIFSNKTPGQDDQRENLYRAKYIGLANDRLDHWDDPLREHEHNYLELYGIPPTLAVVQEEWSRIDGEVAPCLTQAGFDPSVFTRYDGTIAYKKAGQTKRNKSARSRKAMLGKKMKKAGLDPKSAEDLAAAATDPRTSKEYARWREDQDVVDIIDHAQRRFRCEKLFNEASGQGKFTPGVYDSSTTHALANFERKHDIMGWGHFKRDNLAMLALTPDQAVHARLLRVIEERVVMSTGVIEDGSAAQWKKDFRWKDAQGNEHPLPNLVEDYTAAVVEALGMQTPESAKQSLAALSDLVGEKAGSEGEGEGGFEQLLIAVKLPARPAYYADDMKLSTVIDRGDIWYDFPYDELGNKVAQPRSQTPRLTLYVEYEGQKIPLVHWRTTIGSWRTEMSAGEQMLKYKNSDVGPRVWKDIMAAPVWIPPNSTPADELVKGHYRNGKFTRDVNYSEIGPGYRSAYGLVAAYHIKQVVNDDGTVRAELDNGIRTHGSVDYMSILRRFSHGCHRLYNMDAVRLFSFVLRHREYTRLGQQDVGVRRNLEVAGKTYNMRIDTRGYKFELVEPIPVRVTEGRIRGKQQSPIDQYMPMPVKPEEVEDVGADGTALPEASAE
ncbi:L,D-transpeptidase family protein [Paraliomyxa miuraensis]|uniref:L,D-transpeptidase n=1 Tax=Paraliomyxa miuraensis TaxID=376150 RepID=UPI002257A447|nr:L,D-transpeptidase [Paraliomyxa miuraensis]MCX4242139.1 L,D-transpeptidase [Paraliomyxa miuraensis]